MKILEVLFSIALIPLELASLLHALWMDATENFWAGYDAAANHAMDIAEALGLVKSQNYSV